MKAANDNLSDWFDKIQNPVTFSLAMNGMRLPTEEEQAEIERQLIERGRLEK